MKRVRYGNIFIPSHVRVGQWIELNDKEIRDLLLTAGIERPKVSRLTPEEKNRLERQEKRLRAGATKRPAKNLKKPRAPKSS